MTPKYANPKKGLHRPCWRSVETSQSIQRTPALFDAGYALLLTL